MESGGWVVVVSGGICLLGLVVNITIGLLVDAITRPRVAKPEVTSEWVHGLYAGEGRSSRRYTMYVKARGWDFSRGPKRDERPHA